MEPEGSLPCSEERAIGPYSDPDRTFSPCFSKIHYNIILPSTPRSSRGLFPSAIPTIISYEFSLFPMNNSTQSTQMHFSPSLYTIIYCVRLLVSFASFIGVEVPFLQIQCYCWQNHSLGTTKTQATAL